MLIAVPTGVKIFNWMGTMWGGAIRFTTPMLFRDRVRLDVHDRRSLGGHPLRRPVRHPATDSYFVVAHFHYVLFGGTIIGIFAGLYYWFPKFFGHLLDEHLGKWVFWSIVVGINLTFGPMHFLGVDGLPRRMYQWTDGARRGLLQHRVLEPGRSPSLRS